MEILTILSNHLPTTVAGHTEKPSVDVVPTGKLPRPVGTQEHLLHRPLGQVFIAQTSPAVTQQSRGDAVDQLCQGVATPARPVGVGHPLKSCLFQNKGSLKACLKPPYIE